MYIDLTPEQRQLRDDLRSYLDELLTDTAGNSVGVDVGSSKSRFHLTRPSISS